MANWRRITGVAGLVVGATAASAGAVVAAERIAINRLRGRAGPAGEAFGSLRGLDLTDHRLVFWDQRDHGRSGRSAAGSGSIGQLGTDLKAVIDATAPGTGPVVLVGHSMGGMAIMALADQYPGLFGTKVAGAVLISTAARGLDGGSPWMPAPIRPALTRALPTVLNGAAKGKRAILVERGRRASTDLAFLTTRLIGFGDGDVSPDTVAFLEQMIRDTPIEVVARFGQALLSCDMRDSLPTLGRIPVTVVAGEKDRLIAARLGIE